MSHAEQFSSDLTSGRAKRSARRGLMSGSFTALLLTQLLTATNDNIFRWLVIGIAKHFVDKSQVGIVLMAGTACFVLPYLLLAAPAGYLADRYSKRSVIVGCKIAEVAIMALGVVAILTGNLWFIFTVVACMGAQSALFAPAKMGCIPELLGVDRISTANGLMGLTTVVAVVIGTGIGNVISDFVRPSEPGGAVTHLWLAAIVLIGIALAGWVASLPIRRLPSADPSRRFPWNAVPQTWQDIRRLAASRPMLRVALGIAFFWSLGTLANLNIDQFGFEGGVTRQTQIVPLLMSLVVGVGVGSVLAGVWSGGRVELGIVPLGAAGVAFSSMLLFTVHGSLVQPDAAWTGGYVAACIFLVMLGVSAGLFDVPLSAYMQHRSDPQSRGSILAASNFLTFSGILVSSFIFAGLRAPLRPGSLEQVAALQSVSVSPQQNQRISEAADRFELAWQANQHPDLAEHLQTFDGDQREALLAKLLWIDVHERRARKVPLDLNDYRQQHANNEALVAEVYHQAIGRPLCSARQIFLLCGVFTIPVFLYIVFLIPQAFIRFLVWLASKTVYRIRVYGRENLPERGGALLVSNHVSWLDGVLLLLTSSRPIRMMVYSGNFRQRWLRRMADRWGAILIDAGPKSIVRALRTARDALNDGELVCIFPEGGISRTGQVQAFRPGLMKVLAGTNAPVVPVYLDELWGSIFSFEGGKFFWKLPRRWPYPISIYYGQPLEDVTDTHRVRQAVQELGANAVEYRKQRLMSLSHAMIRMCKRRKFRSKLADSSGADVTGGSYLMRTLILRRLLRRHTLRSSEKRVGLLLPPMVGGVIANMAVTLDRRVAINLNYTVSADVVNQCVRRSGIRHVLTSRRFAEKLESTTGLDVTRIEAEMVYLEDFRERVTWSDKLTCALAAYVVPAGVLARALRLGEIEKDDDLTIVFTSGSTGEPKGVMLSYANIAANVEAVDQVIHLNSRDVIIGILPLFHSFGYTVTLWAVTALDLKGVYHFSPLDAKQIGKLAQKHAATILLATPTFLRSYARRCSKEQFETLDVVVAGAEKLPTELCDQFDNKFGVRPVEGYGATELSPLVSVNIPASRSMGNFQIDRKEGTVGRTVPGVTARIVDPDSGQELGAGQPGMLLIKGPNVMKGYLDSPDKTAEVIREGWYVTGDIAVIDDDGFIHITGRQSRFSKIGGEMVPHIKIEETLEKILGEEEEGVPQVAVTAVPHPKKGERLVVVHRALAQTPDQLCEALREAGLPNLYIPSTDSFVQVEELPVLGSGKLDLKAIEKIARHEFAPTEPNE